MRSGILGSYNSNVLFYCGRVGRELLRLHFVAREEANLCAAEECRGSDEPAQVKGTHPRCGKTA